MQHDIQMFNAVKLSGSSVCEPCSCFFPPIHFSCFSPLQQFLILNVLFEKCTIGEKFNAVLTKGCLAAVSKANPCIDDTKHQE